MLQIKEEDQSPSPSGPINPPSPFLIVANKFMGGENERHLMLHRCFLYLFLGPVILNVGGKRHEVRWNTLDKFPTSRLGRLRHCVTHRGLLKICDAYSLEEREYFFDRSPRNFDAILGLYRNGKLHLAAGVSWFGESDALYEFLMPKTFLFDLFSKSLVKSV